MKVCKIEKKKEVIDVDYEICSDDYCCDKMRQWLRIGTRSRNNLRCSIDTNRFEICVREASGSYCGRDELDKSAYEDLNFCPFCGANVYNTESSMGITIPVKISYHETPKKKHWWSR